MESSCRGALCALILFVFYFVLSLIWKGGMGDGDIKLAFILGLLLGWLGWPQFIIGSFAAFFIGGAISLVLLASKRSTFMEASPLGHPCCSAHGLAFSPAYQSPHYTCNSPDLRNASAYKTHIYKERP